MSDKPINPELILRCAKEVDRIRDWKWEKNRFDVMVLRCHWWEDGSREKTFDPTFSADDREALMLVLLKKENGAWYIRALFDGGYQAIQYGLLTQRIGKVVGAESFPMLLLKAASAQWGIPMYLTEEKT